MEAEIALHVLLFARIGEKGEGNKVHIVVHGEGKKDSRLLSVSSHLGEHEQKRERRHLRGGKRRRGKLREKFSRGD